MITPVNVHEQVASGTYDNVCDDVRFEITDNDGVWSVCLCIPTAPNSTYCRFIAEGLTSYEACLEAGEKYQPDANELHLAMAAQDRKEGK